MSISKEEVLKIAKLSDLEIKDNEIDKYLQNLEDILDFVDIVNKAPVDDLDVTIGTNSAKNVFREDNVENFEDIDMMLQNAPEKSRNMFKIPKVL